ncbi:MAG: hypothetical protein IJ133_02175, partial [Clostridia bacterium]|nr:hypothetical protein [Clostridia bacterium]
VKAKVEDKKADQKSGDLKEKISAKPQTPRQRSATKQMPHKTRSPLSRNKRPETRYQKAGSLRGDPVFSFYYLFYSMLCVLRGMSPSVISPTGR